MACNKAPRVRQLDGHYGASRTYINNNGLYKGSTQSMEPTNKWGSKNKKIYLTKNITKCIVVIAFSSN